MGKINQNDDRQCENCGKPLFGRTDKRFCNDGCRNTFNRNKSYLQRTEEEDKNHPEILKIIRNNYRILKAVGGIIEEGSTCFFKAKILEDEGFNFNFCTSVLLEDGMLWKFCFERGWYVDEAGNCSVCDRHEMTGI